MISPCKDSQNFHSPQIFKEEILHFPQISFFRFLHSPQKVFLRTIKTHPLSLSIVPTTLHRIWYTIQAIAMRMPHIIQLKE